MLVNGDKLVVTKSVAGFLNEGDIVEVIDVNENGLISFAFGDGFMHKGLMNAAEYEEHFEKVASKGAPSVTSERIDEIVENSQISIQTAFDKCTIVTCQLPNGFVIVESSACVSPENYDKELGVDICMDRIRDRIWELEGYRLQEELYRESGMAEYHDCDCDDCDCDEDDFLNDADCDDCDDYDCPYNANYDANDNI